MNALSHDNVRFYLLFALLLVFHLVANLWWVAHDNHAITCDEQYHMQGAQAWYEEMTAEPIKPLFQQALALGKIESRYPPLLYLAGALTCAVFGYGTDTLVLTSTLLLWIVIVGAYGIGRTLLEWRGALFVAFVTSLLPLVHGFSRSFATDYLAAAIVVWAMLALLRCDGFRNRRWVIAFAVLNGLGFLARPTAFLFYLAPCVVVMAMGLAKSWRPVAANIAATVGVAIVIAAPWYLYHFAYFSAFWEAYSEEHAIFTVSSGLWKPGLTLAVATLCGWAHWRGPRERLAALAVPALFVAFGVMIAALGWKRWSIYPIHAVNNAVFLPTFLLAMAGTFLMCGKEHRRFPFVMMVVWLLGSYVLATSVLHGTAPRYLLPVAPAFGVLAVMALNAIPHAAARRAAMWLFAALLVFDYADMVLVPYGPLRKAQLPLFSDNHYARVFGDSGLVVYKDELRSSSYILRPPCTGDNYVDRILLAIQRADSGKAGPAAIYQRVDLYGSIFRKENGLGCLNPFVTPELIPREITMERPLVALGPMGKTPQDLREKLPETDYIAFRAGNLATDREASWRAFFERAGFRVIERFEASGHQMTLAGSSVTVMERAAPAQREVVRRWDFTELDKSEWEWEFLGGAEPTPEGALCVPENNRPWIWLSDIGLKADGVTAVRVRLGAASGKLIFYWARPGDIVEGEWPFSNKRGVEFGAAAGEAGVYEAKLKLHKKWTGTIERAFISLDLPEADGVSEVHLQEIAFLR